MTFQFGTQNELLYAFYGASTNLATFTAEDNLLKTYPACEVPSLRQILGVTGLRSSSLKVKARGLAGTTGTPTYTFTLRLITSETWSAGGLVLGVIGVEPDQLPDAEAVRRELNNDNDHCSANLAACR